MKRIGLALLTFVAMHAMAETPQEIYNRIPTLPNVEQLAQGNEALSQVETQYDMLIKELDRIIEQNSIQYTALQQKFVERHSKAAKPTARQQEISREVGNDIMATLAASGISIEQLSKMSEEEIEALVSPMMASKVGLSAAEMQKLQSMSDKDAEAYVRSHPEMAARMQHSQYGQYGKEMQGMPTGAYNLTDEESEIIDQIIELTQTSNNKNAQFPIAQPQIDTESLSAPYETRINALLDEFWARANKDSKPDINGLFHIPAYRFDYYNRINAIADEYNVAVAQAWSAQWDPYIQSMRNECLDELSKSKQITQLYNRLSEDGKLFAASSYLSYQGATSTIRQYLQMLKKRLKVPHMDHYTAPDTFGGMG